METIIRVANGAVGIYISATGLPDILSNLTYQQVCRRAVVTTVPSCCPSPAIVSYLPHRATTPSSPCAHHHG